MCYSAMVEQNAKKLAQQFSAEIYFEAYAELFERRLQGEKLIINKGMEFPFLKSATSLKEKQIGKSIRQWHEKEIERLEMELQKQTERQKKAEASLGQKPTKKAQEDLRISTNKISKCKYDLKKHSSEDLESDSDERIFPFNYASVLIEDAKGKRTIRPMRYHLRPHNQDESFDRTHDGCYNARFNNLTRVPFWNESLVQGRRGVMVIKRFYENVPVERYLQNKKLPAKLVDRENIVVAFEPKSHELMFIPILWDCWKKKGSAELFSMALITDDPPPEIQATGHDRCPIFLQKEAIDEWLSEKDRDGKTIKEQILSQRETPFYEHKVLDAG